MRIDDRLADARAELERLATLGDVVRWSRAIAAVIVQDEFTHDVVVPWRPGAWLVFDTT